MNMQKKISDFSSFWPCYLREHSKPLTRRFHYIGTGLGIICIFLGALNNILFIALTPILTYGFAWFSHFFIEKNKPATFTYPFWSLIGDLKMFFLWLSGKLKPHLIKAGIKN